MMIDNQSEQLQSEQLRQQYLAALGVTQWLPRQTLPGAAASPVWRWQAAMPDSSPGLKPTAVSGLSSAAARPITHNAPLRQLVQGVVEAVVVQPGQSAGSLALPAERSPVAAPAHQAAAVMAVVKPAAGPEFAVPTTASTATDSTRALPSSASTTIPRFRLAMVSYSDCLVITDLPTSQAQVWSSQHQQLLNAIVAAVGLGGNPQASSAVHEFQWPLDPLARFDQSEPIARHALQVALAGVQQPSHRVLLLMGKSAQAYLLQPEQIADLGQLIDHQGHAALCCHGLNEVLRLPGLKAELWRQLQPLRKLPDGL